jgi:hypothetical protein
MPTNQPRDQREQEVSIKERSHELFLKNAPPEGYVPAKPFEVHLRETPAKPLSPLTTAILWVVGTLVAILFIATVFRIFQRHNATPRPAATSPVSSWRIPSFSAHLVRVDPNGRKILVESRGTNRGRAVLSSRNSSQVGRIRAPNHLVLSANPNTNYGYFGPVASG